MSSNQNNSLPILSQSLKPLRKPKWIRVQTISSKSFNLTRDIVREHGLHTICEEALCPNRNECWHHGTATFLLLGDICTRGCKFCAVTTGRPAPPDPSEPERIAQSSEKMNLRHIVLTSVNRDDLPDGGASHFVSTVSAIKKRLPNSTIELLIPDFQGNWDALRLVVESDIAILNHNLETVSRLYRKVRPSARYTQSLELLDRAHRIRSDISTKSGIMVGLGEEPSEVMALLSDLRKIHCSIVTIGQYLQPTPTHLPVVEYVPLPVFDDYRREGQRLGFTHIESAPFVRSSYHAEKHV